MSLGEALKEARKRKGLTQKQLAQKIGVKHGALSNWENNQNLPNGSTMLMLMKVLNLEFQDIFGKISLGNVAKLEEKKPSELTKIQRLMLDVVSATMSEVIEETNLKNDAVQLIDTMDDYKKRLVKVFRDFEPQEVYAFIDALEDFTRDDLFEVYRAIRHIRYDKENPLLFYAKDGE